MHICIVVSDSGGASLAPRLPRSLFASLPSVHRSVLNPCSRNSSQQQSASLFWLRRRRRILVVRVSTQFAVHINIYTASLCPAARPFHPIFGTILIRLQKPNTGMTGHPIVVRSPSRYALVCVYRKFDLPEQCSVSGRRRDFVWTVKCIILNYNAVIATLRTFILYMCLCRCVYDVTRGTIRHSDNSTSLTPGLHHFQLKRALLDYFSLRRLIRLYS